MCRERDLELREEGSEGACFAVGPELVWVVLVEKYGIVRQDVVVLTRATLVPSGSFLKALEVAVVDPVLSCRSASRRRARVRRRRR